MRLLFLSIILVSVISIDVFIDNKFQGSSTGSQAAPFQTFEQAYTLNLSKSIYTQYPSVYFINTGVSYSVSFSFFEPQVQAMFSINTYMPESQSCDEYAVIQITGTGINVTNAAQFTMVLNNIALDMDLSDSSQNLISINVTKTGNINFQSSCWSSQATNKQIISPYILMNSAECLLTFYQTDINTTTSYIANPVLSINSNLTVVTMNQTSIIYSSANQNSLLKSYSPIFVFENLNSNSLGNQGPGNLLLNWTTLQFNYQTENIIPIFSLQLNMTEILNTTILQSEINTKFFYFEDVYHLIVEDLKMIDLIINSTLGDLAIFELSSFSELNMQTCSLTQSILPSLISLKISNPGSIIGLYDFMIEESNFTGDGMIKIIASLGEMQFNDLINFGLENFLIKSSSGSLLLYSYQDKNDTLHTQALLSITNFTVFQCSFNSKPIFFFQHSMLSMQNSNFSGNNYYETSLFTNQPYANLSMISASLILNQSNFENETFWNSSLVTMNSYLLEPLSDLNLDYFVTLFSECTFENISFIPIGSPYEYGLFQISTPFQFFVSNIFNHIQFKFQGLIVLTVFSLEGIVSPAEQRRSDEAKLVFQNNLILGLLEEYFPLCSYPSSNQGCYFMLFKGNIFSNINSTQIINAQGPSSGLLIVLTSIFSNINLVFLGPLLNIDHYSTYYITDNIFNDVISPMTNFQTALITASTPSSSISYPNLTYSFVSNNMFGSIYLSSLLDSNNDLIGLVMSNATIVDSFFSTTVVSVQIQDFFYFYYLSNVLSGIGITNLWNGGLVSALYATTYVYNQFVILENNIFQNVNISGFLPSQVIEPSNALIYLYSLNMDEIYIENLTISGCHIEISNYYTVSLTATAINITNLLFSTPQNNNSLGYISIQGYNITLTNAQLDFKLDVNEGVNLVQLSTILIAEPTMARFDLKNIQVISKYPDFETFTPSDHLFGIQGSILDVRVESLHAESNHAHIFSMSVSENLGLKFDNIYTRTEIQSLVVFQVPVKKYVSIDISNYHDDTINKGSQQSLVDAKFVAVKSFNLMIDNLRSRRLSLLYLSSQSANITFRNSKIKFYQQEVIQTYVLLILADSISVKIKDITISQSGSNLILAQISPPFRDVLNHIEIDNLTLIGSVFNNVFQSSGPWQVLFNKITCNSCGGALINFATYYSKINIQNVMASNASLQLLKLEQASKTNITMENITLLNFSSPTVLIQARNINITLQNFISDSSNSNIILTDSHIILENYTCMNNVIKSVGGCLDLQNATLQTLNTFIMENNSARAGGAIYTSFMPPLDNLSNVSSNKATSYGNSYASDAVSIVMSINQTSENSFLSSQGYYNYTVSPQNSSYYILNNLSLSFVETSIILLNFYDSYNNEAKFLSFPSLKENRTLVHFLADNSIILPVNKITLNPGLSNTSIQIHISYQEVPSDFIIEFQMRACVPGEFFDNSTGCNLCGVGFYSLTPSQPCTICPDNANCPGGMFLNVSQGYWRADGDDQIIPCPNLSPSCGGGINPLTQCSTGYSGALCEGCDPNGFSIDASGNCVACDENIFLQILDFLFIFLFGFAWEIFSIIRMKNSISSYEKILKDDIDTSSKERMFITRKLGLIVRLLTTYTQFFSIVFSFSVFSISEISQASDIVSKFLSIFSFSSVKSINSIDCLLTNFGTAPENITYTKLILWNSIPPVKIILVGIALLFMYLKRYTSNFKSNFLTAIFVIIFYEQPGLILNLALFSTCFLKDQSSSGWSELDPNLSCSSSQYMIADKSLAIPELILWGLVIPFIFYLITFVNRHRLDDSKVLKSYGGLVLAYRPEIYYWSSLVMIMKILLIFCLTVIQNEVISYEMCFVIFVVYSYLFGKRSPLEDEQLRQVESYAIFVFELTFGLLIISYSSDDQMVIEGAMLLILLFGVGIIGSLLYILIKTGVKWREIQKLRRREKKFSRLGRKSEINMASQSYGSEIKEENHSEVDEKTQSLLDNQSIKL